MKIFKYALLILLLCSLLSSCKDDDEDNTPTKRQILRVFVDGELQPATAIFTNSDDFSQYNETRRDFQLHATLKDFNFSLSTTNWSWQGMPNKGPKVKTYFPSDGDRRDCKSDEDFNFMCEMATVLYYTTTDTLYLTRLYENKDNQVGISRNSNNTIDGYFNVVCTNLDDDTVHIEGSFNDIIIE